MNGTVTDAKDLRAVPAYMNVRVVEGAERKLQIYCLNIMVELPAEKVLNLLKIKTEGKDV